MRTPAYRPIVRELLLALVEDVVAQARRACWRTTGTSYEDLLDRVRTGSTPSAYRGISGQ